MSKRKIHAKVFGDHLTFCGRLASKVSTVQVPGGRFLRESDGVTCGHCWRVAA